MVKGLNVKCRHCLRKFWAEIKLGFGVRKHKDDEMLLNCILDEVRLSFKCPFCKEKTAVGVEFFSERVEMNQIVENPDYIG